MIGAFTTFSTFCKETVELMVGGKYFLAASYMVVSSILGFAAIYLGTVLARKVITVLVRNAKKNDMEITGNDEENQ
ncbi:MAG: CrcB family protein [Acidaminococcaceae bacterium]|nr:CrcB family protein [Acidaminococcaceae bacterium]